MTIIIWRIACLVSAALFVVGILVLMFSRFVKNKYYHAFNADELMKKTRMTNAKNSIYFTTGETRKYIDKYAVCKTAYDKYIVCNFVKKYTYIRYFVLEYNRRKRVKRIQQVDERNTDSNSKIITLHKRSKYVNVVIGTADDMVINKDVIRPLSHKKIRLYAFFKSATLFTGLFAVRHLILEFILKDSLKLYLSNTLNYYSVGLCLIIGILSYLFTVLCFRRKSGKALNGGALEYEFL